MSGCSRTARWNEAVDLAAVETDVREAFDDGIKAVAIAFMHAWAYPEHELAAEDGAMMGFSQISVSHKVSPLAKLVGRGDTTVVDAYLSPILRRYVDQVASELGVSDAPGGTRLQFMMSSGGLTAADLFQGKDAILSGPAGGVVGMVETAKAEGFHDVIGFDMGGTSTDVAHYAGDYERAFDTEVAGVRIRAPMMRIHTVAAGGGSILHYEAGPLPGRAGFGRRQSRARRLPARRTADRHRRQRDDRQARPGHFPAIFGPEQDQPLDADGAGRNSADLAEKVGDGRTPEEVAEGFITIAVENMANAIKKISVQRGYDVTGYALNCFGGAGGQHACLVADALGMKAVLIHPYSGLLSAYGIEGLAARAGRTAGGGQPRSHRRADRRSWRGSHRRTGNAGHRDPRHHDAAGAASALRRHRHDHRGAPMTARTSTRRRRISRPRTWRNSASPTRRAG
jgi:5-oxoprolinase (ATP-hydrolysing)